MPIELYIEERHDFNAAPQGSPSPGVMYVFMLDGEPYSCDFLCPCGCGSSCYTVFKGSHPRCCYSPGPTLTPSIRYLDGCKAHFNITDGKVIMHGDSGK
jgi:Family of unknown function (DUF6527)